MTPFYCRLTQSCKTLNQINRVHIALENYLTPSKLDTMLAHRNSDDSSTHFGQWINKQFTMYSKAKKQMPEPFLRRKITSHLHLYSNDPFKKEDRKQKTLVVCFTGAAQRMMMPLAVFLQHFDASSVDVALIRYPKGKGYRKGIDDLGDDIDQAFIAVMDHLEGREYGKTVAIGVSGGAAVALLFGLREDVKAVLGVGINHPDDERWSEENGVSLRERIKNSAQVRSTVPPIHLLYGRESSADKEAAFAVSQIVPLLIREVSHKSSSVGHVALHPIVMEGGLSSLLESTLLSEGLR